MKTIPSRFRRLDGALADLPLDEPMLLTELDGFLTGILLAPDRIAPGEWMQSVWGVDDGTPPFDDPLDVRWFADAVMARHDEILRELSRGRPQPILDVDDRNGDILWELWLDGFAQAMDLRPDRWAGLRDDADDAALAAFATLLAIARDESDLDSMAINALDGSAPGVIREAVLRLHALRVEDGIVSPAVSASPAKVGRNDPCRCGSGRKSKRCCR